MKQETLHKILEKSLTKKDGIYVLEGVVYKVKNKHPKFFADYGNILQLSFGFLVSIGKYEWTGADSGRKVLKKII